MSASRCCSESKWVSDALRKVRRDSGFNNESCLMMLPMAPKCGRGSGKSLEFPARLCGLSDVPPSLCSTSKACADAGIPRAFPFLAADLTIRVGNVCHQRGGYAIDRAAFCNQRRSIAPPARNKFPLPRQLRISDQSHLEHHTMWRVPEKKSCSSRSELAGSFSG